MTGEWWSLSDAATWVQQEFARAHRTVSRKTVSRWAHERKVRAELRGSRWYIHVASLKEHVTLLLRLPNRETVSTAMPEEPQTQYLLELRRFAEQRNAGFLRELERGVD